MLRVEGLRRQVGDFQLRIDQWTIEQGKYLVLVGPSGAGKTMFLETVAGLHSPDAGRIWIGDREATQLPPERRSIGFLYQDCWLFPHLTVGQNIEFGRRYHREAGGPSGPRTEELAEMLHIGDLLERKPQTLSGGERQRVALARALAVRPRLLFLDEPLGTLDPVTRERVAGELQACHKSLGTTTIHVTHDHTEARMIGDAVAVIFRGRLEQCGPTSEVFQRPSTVELAGFLGCENLFEVEATKGVEQGMVRIQLGDCSFELCSDRAGPVAFCVRPENLLVEPPGGGTGHHPGNDAYNILASFTGQVVETSQRGAMVRLVVDAGGCQWVSLISCSQQHSYRFGRGDAVKLRIPVDALHLIPLE